MGVSGLEQMHGKSKSEMLRTIHDYQRPAASGGEEEQKKKKPRSTLATRRPIDSGGLQTTRLGA